MGIQINGNTDTISAVDGNLNLTGAELPSVTNLNATGIVTASSFRGALAGNVTGNLTGNVNATGVSTFSGGVVVAAGSTSAPSISPSGDSNTGIFFPSPDTVVIGEGGVEALRINSSGSLVTSGNVGIRTTEDGTFGGFSQPNLYIKQTATNWTGGIHIESTSDQSLGTISMNSSGFEFGQSYRSSGSYKDINFYTSGVKRATIDTSGRVTTPAQPFVAGGSAAVAVSGNEQHVWATSGFVFSNIGNHWNASTGVFTAPVDGVYYVSAGIRYSSVSVTPPYIYIYFLASYQSASGSPILLWSPGTESGGTYRPRFLTALMYCRANDTIRPRLYVPSGTITIDGGPSSQTDCFLNIYLLG